MALLTAVALFTVAGALLWDGEPFRTNAAAILQPPSAQFPLGTDQLGRDVLARMLSAGLVSIPMGIAAIGVGAVIGSAIGLVSGFVGGRLDCLTMRVVDVDALVPAAARRAGRRFHPRSQLPRPRSSPFPWRRSRAMPALCAPPPSRSASAPFIDAAVVSSTQTPRLITRHVTRNVMDVVVPLLVIGMGNGMIVLAALSFLGIGVQPPQADWGVMLTDGVRSIYTAPLVALAPALILYLTVAGINLTGEALGVKLGAGGRTRVERT